MIILTQKPKVPIAITTTVIYVINKKSVKCSMVKKASPTCKWQLHAAINWRPCDLELQYESVEKYRGSGDNKVAFMCIHWHTCYMTNKGPYNCVRPIK